jgi:hypothetical protein
MKLLNAHDSNLATCRGLLEYLHREGSIENGAGMI